MIPERNESAKFARSVFFEKYNDIDVFIEDTAHGYEKIFVELLNRVLGETLKVAAVFPIGPRDSVVRKCREMQGRFVRPTLFIVDGDLFLLAGDCIDAMPGLYRLPTYCIENLLIDGAAVLDVMNEEDPMKGREELRQLLDYPGWVRHNQELLFQLFVEYAISFALNPAVQTVRYPVTSLVSGANGLLDENKVLSRVALLRESTVAAAGRERYDETRARVLESAAIQGIPQIHFASGKDYLLPLLKARLKSIVKTRIPDINLKLRLAMKCNSALLQNIHDHIGVGSTVVPA